MSRQYLRSYDLTIIPINKDTIVIEKLRIKFDITKTLLSIPNLCKIELFNPNDTTLSALQDKDTKIILNAGYEDNKSLLFKGEIRNVFQVRQDVDRIVTIYAGDGERDWRNSFFNKTYSENVNIKTIIQDIFNSFKDTSIGIVDGLPDIVDKLRGQTLSGSSKELLDMYASEYGFEWSIQDGEITVSSEDKFLEENEVILINSATGMIGSPTVTEIGADVNTLLNPKLLPNFGFKIESVNAVLQLGNLFFRDIKRTTAEGVYKIQEVNFKGDSREGEWMSSVKGRIVNE